MLMLLQAWRVTDEITLRASEQTAIKAPDLGDLFLPQVVSYSTGNDPCDYRNRGTGRNPDVREANCLADGLDQTLFQQLLTQLLKVCLVVTLTCLTKQLKQKHLV